jgi:hypothetical protein
MGKNSQHPWGFKKEGPKPLLHRGAEYPHRKRAEEVYSQWLSGFDEREIAAFFEIDVLDVMKDIQYVQQHLSQRSVLAHVNDRNRLMIQKLEGHKYHQKLSEVLSIPAKVYLQAGINPVAPLKEYRESVSMTERPGALSVNFTKNTANIGIGSTWGGIPAANLGGSGKIRCYEDLLRMIIANDPSCGLQPVTTDIEAKEIEVPGNPQAEDVNEEEPTGEDSGEG